MGATYAELHVAGRVFVLRRCTYGVSQATGPRGRPVERVRHHGIDGEMDVPRDPFLEHWAATAYLPLAGHITFSGGPGEPAIETVSWEAGQCVLYREEFHRGSITDGSYICFWRIVAATLVFSAGPPAPFVAAAPREHGTPPPVALVPPLPPLPALLPLNKQGRYNARMALMQRARTGLTTTPDEAAQTALTRLTRNNVAVERAKLSAHAYTSVRSTKKPPFVDPPEGWHMLEGPELAVVGASPEMLVDKKSGLIAAVYQSEFEVPPKYVISFAGTKTASGMGVLLKDAQVDAAQGIGLETEQYNRAMKLTDAVVRKIGADEVETTGHSLGGGLASAGSVVTGVKGYTFNAAGLHANTVKRPPYNVSRQKMEDRGASIDAYHSVADPLNNFQNFANIPGGVIIPKALGTSHLVEKAPHWQRSVGHRVLHPLQAGGEGHSIAPQMIDHIEHQKDQDTAVLTNYLAP